MSSERAEIDALEDSLASEARRKSVEDLFNKYLKKDYSFATAGHPVLRSRRGWVPSPNSVIFHGHFCTSRDGHEGPHEGGRGQGVLKRL